MQVEEFEEEKIIEDFPNYSITKNGVVRNIKSNKILK